MATDTSTPTTDPDELPEPLAEIREQFEHIRRLREEVLPAETRKLAEMIAATRDHDDPRVHPAGAARAMGTAKGYAYELVNKLRDGHI